MGEKTIQKSAPKKASKSIKEKRRDKKEKQSTEKGLRGTKA